MYTDIFIVRRDCVFRNFRIFPFLEKAVCFHLEKMLICLFSLRRKDTEMWYFRNTKISENPQKYNLFVYFHVFSPCEKKGFCAVGHMSLVILRRKKLLERFTKKNCKKQIKKSLELKK